MQVVVSTTNSAIQYYAFDSAGNIKSGWPRYNTDVRKKKEKKKERKTPPHSITSPSLLQTGATNDANPGNDNFDGINGFGMAR